MIARALSGLALLVAGSTLALADSVSGTIVAFDRKARIIVMDDKTIWTLEQGDVEVPEDLKAGDKIEITWESLAEDGRGIIQSIQTLNE